MSKAARENKIQLLRSNRLATDFSTETAEVRRQSTGICHPWPSKNVSRDYNKIQAFSDVQKVTLQCQPIHTKEILKVLQGENDPKWNVRDGEEQSNSKYCT